MKRCCKCGIEKPKTEFYANKRQYDGVSTYCKPCHKRDTADRNSLRLKIDPEYRALKIEKTIKWRKENAEHVQDYAEKYYQENIDAIKAHNKKRRHALNAHKKKRNRSVENRTPTWLDDVDRFEMECIYKYCEALRNVGLKYEVDHIIPLLGKHVSGLHVPSNLQVLTQKENRKKHNKFEVI